MVIEASTLATTYSTSSSAFGQCGEKRRYPSGAVQKKLKRDVAIKVLPDAFSRDNERLARLEREAQLLASLNHPNVSSIYGVEDAEGVKALVLELVEGPTLADRIAGEPIPLDEVIAIARQMADDLEAAHEVGIIHRDLKPPNVKVREDGTVKVLDFGLAKHRSRDRRAIDRRTDRVQVGILSLHAKG